MSAFAAGYDVLKADSHSANSEGLYHPARIVTAGGWGLGWGVEGFGWRISYSRMRGRFTGTNKEMRGINKVSTPHRNR